MTLSLCEIITVDRLLVLLEVAVIGVAAFLAYKVGRKQNQINENLLGLHLIPRITVTCKQSENKIFISNQGGSTMNVWGFEGKGFSDKIHEEPVTIEPNTSINIEVPNLFQISTEKTEYFKEIIFIFITANDGKRYKLKSTIHFDFIEGNLKGVRAQNHPLENWTE